jgi:hypothetical protein
VQAQITGQTVQGLYIYPGAGDVYQDLGTTTVGPGVEFNAFGLTNYDIDGNTITITSSNSGGVFYTPAAFNGFRLFDVTGTIPSFTSFGIQSSDLAGFDASRLFFTDDALSVNLESLSFAPETRLVLDFTTAEVTAVPEPASLVLLATGLLGVLGVARRRSRTA